MTTCNIGYELSNDEYFYNILPAHITPSVLIAYAPKLMPQISMGSKKVFTKESISRGIFCNDPSCKPSPGSTIKMQNFITVKPFPNESPSFPRKENPPKSRMMKKHNKFLLKVLHNDIRGLYFTNRV